MADLMTPTIFNFFARLRGPEVALGESAPAFLALEAQMRAEREFAIDGTLPAGRKRRLGLIGLMRQFGVRGIADLADELDKLGQHDVNDAGAHYRCFHARALWRQFSPRRWREMGLHSIRVTQILERQKRAEKPSPPAEPPRELEIPAPIRRMVPIEDTDNSWMYRPGGPLDDRPAPGFGPRREY